MAASFCTFICTNKTGIELLIGNPEISYGTHLAIEASLKQPDGGMCYVPANGLPTKVGETKGSGGCGSEGVITFDNSLGHWGVKWDNPLSGEAKTLIQAAPPGGKIEVRLENDVWNITCTMD